MDLAEAISGRRSTRAYKDKPVAAAVIRRVIDAAVQALLDRISHEAKAHMMATMPADMWAGAHAGRIHAMLSDPAFQIFYHAPVLILISAHAPGAARKEPEIRWLG